MRVVDVLGPALGPVPGRPAAVDRFQPEALPVLSFRCRLGLWRSW